MMLLGWPDRSVDIETKATLHTSVSDILLPFISFIYFYFKTLLFSMFWVWLRSRCYSSTSIYLLNVDASAKTTPTTRCANTCFSPSTCQEMRRLVVVTKVLPFTRSGPLLSTTNGNARRWIFNTSFFFTSTPTCAYRPLLLRIYFPRWKILGVRILKAKINYIYLWNSWNSAGNENVFHKTSAVLNLLHSQTIVSSLSQMCCATAVPTPATMLDVRVMMRLVLKKRAKLHRQPASVIGPTAAERSGGWEPTRPMTFPSAVALRCCWVALVFPSILETRG